MTELVVLIVLVSVVCSAVAWEVLRPSGAWEEWHEEMEALERVVKR